MLQVINPADESVIRTLETDSKSAILEKVLNAKKAQSAWAARPYPERAKCLAQFAKALKENLEKLAKDLTAEMGKTIEQARAEILSTIPRVEYFVQNVPQATKGENFGIFEGNTEEQITFEPLGVIANISAWNYPYFVSINVIAPALLTGNAVVYKPSELSMLSGLNMTRMLHEAGVPTDVFSVVVGDGEAGRNLVDAPINGIFFTGSKATGQKIAAQTAGRMIRLQLELGGKDAVYVCEDANLDSAAESIAEGFLYNSGQGCCSVERIYVHQEISRKFIDALKKYAPQFAVAPLAQKAHAAFLADQVSEALEKGAKLELGGEKIHGRIFEPTILSNCKNDLRFMQEESFGPVVGLASVESDDEAIKLINDSEYGLTAAVYSKNIARAKSILSRVNVGTAYINCCDRVSPRLPWSGRNNSGTGATASWIGIQSFVQPKAWHVRGS